MAGTDLFNSTKGQYTGYTTLIGGKPPKIDDSMVELFADVSAVTVISESFSTIDVGIAPTGSPVAAHGFRVNAKNDLGDFVSIVEYKTGETAGDFKIGVLGRYVSGSSYLYGQVDNQNGKISIFKEGTTTALATESISELVANRTYWLVGIFVGGVVRCAHYTEDPRNNPIPAASVTHVLSAADATTFDVVSATGVVGWVPIDDGARVISIETGQAFVDNTSTISTVLNQKHVDIRDFINYRYPVRYRNMRELNTFHVAEKAFSQVVTLSNAATAGTFSLLFYPSDTEPYVPEEFGPYAFDISNDALKLDLNNKINLLPRFSVASADPIKNVNNSLGSGDYTLTVEFDETYGEINLLRIVLDDLLPVDTSSEEAYDPDTAIGTFAAVQFDQGYIETADPINTMMTVDDLRIEYKFKNENWIFRRGFNNEVTYPPPGTSAPLKSHFRDADLSIGKVSAEGNRNGASVKFSRAMNKVGPNWSVYLQSATKPINCVAIGSEPGVRPSLVDDENLTINMIMSDFPWDPATGESVLEIFKDWDEADPGCFIQFTSSKDGSFSSNANANSAPVAFKDHLYWEGTTPSRVEFIAKLSEFADGAEFDFSKITGVRVYLSGRMVSTVSTVSIMSIRCVDTTSKKWLTAEINTLEQAVTSPIPGYDEDVTGLVPMISGMSLATTASDPSPIDSKQSLQFRAGRGAATEFNKFMLFAREIEFDDMFRSTWLTAEFGFVNSSPDAYLHRYQTCRIKSAGDVVLYWDVHPGGVYSEQYTGTLGLSHLPALLEDKNYEFSVQFVSNSIKTQIIELNSGGQPTQTLYDAPLATSEKWMPLAGRIGWYVELQDKDIQIDAFDLDSAGYAVLRTKPFVSETPLEGAQLFTVDSGDKNLFKRFYAFSTGDQVYIDNQKTTSTEGSFVLESFGSTEYPGLISNEFTIDDWSHMYIEFDIWVPQSLRTDALRPKMLLLPAEQPEGTSGLDVFSGIVPSDGPFAFDFTPGAWSTVYYDLRGINAKNGNYFLVIVSDGDGLRDESVFRNKWWIDNVQINTQTIEWEIRALEGGSWTPFKRNINQQYSALHLSENQIGRYIQLQARALTEDAWIAEYTLFPKYQELGRLI